MMESGSGFMVLSNTSVSLLKSWNQFHGSVYRHLSHLETAPVLYWCKKCNKARVDLRLDASRHKFLLFTGMSNKLEERSHKRECLALKQVNNWKQGNWERFGALSIIRQDLFDSTSTKPNFLNLAALTSIKRPPAVSRKTTR